MATSQGTAIMPTVFYKDPLAALRWLEIAFGFETSMVVTDESGAVQHAETTWRGTVIGIAGEFSSPKLIGPAQMKSPAALGGAGTQFIRLEADGDLDACCERARSAGARITQEPADQFYGQGTWRALDLEGHVWTFHQPLTQPAAGAASRGLKIRRSLDEEER